MLSTPVRTTHYSRTPLMIQITYWHVSNDPLCRNVAVSQMPAACQGVAALILVIMLFSDY